MKAPKSEGGNFEKHPEGWTTGVCTRVIDLGTHWNERNQKYQRKLMLAFESSKLMNEGEYAGQPFLLFANFNYSMYKNAHLCGFIEDWRGKRFSTQEEADAFDLSKLIGQAAFMNVSHSDDGKFTNIMTIGPVPEGMTAPAIVGKTILIDQDDLNQKEVEKLTDRMKAKVLGAKEQTEVGEPDTGQPKQPTTQTPTETEQNKYDERNPPPDFDDDIPF
jgi:hypothetical protein